jgi:CRISPR-associated protein Cas1
MPKVELTVLSNPQPRPVRATENLLVPARMLNEVLYCERLMYLEWVQGEWADNFFTADGSRVHRRVDARAKPLKPRDARGKLALGAGEGAAREEERPYQARSVWLSSERLGLTAKIDVVDVDGGTVLPVEYKRGKRPDVAEAAWLPERAQLCAQVMLLREHGYRCDEGHIYYAADHARVPIAITGELEAQVSWAVQRARALLEQDRPPPPLEDSPKCRGCSLVGICLPDETHHLRKSEAEVPSEEEGADECVAARVRRLIPASDDKLPLYVQEQGARIGLSQEVLKVTSRDGTTVEARLPQTSQVALLGNVQISTQALREAILRNIPITFFTTGGWFIGRTVSTDSKNVGLRYAQYAATQSKHQCLLLARQFVSAKIRNCRTLLRRNHGRPNATALFELKQLAVKAEESDAVESLLGLEGTAARTYFGEFTGMLKPPGDELYFAMEGRNRRPPRDPINALLSFTYALLTKDLSLSCTNVGLDPLLGFYHQPHFGRPSLALDLMEEFRPIIADSVVINVVNNGIVQSDDFIEAAGGFALKDEARRRLIQAFERRMDQLVIHPVFDYRITYRRVLEVQARLLARWLQGEVPKYPSFRVR